MRFIPGGSLTIQSLDPARADRAVQVRSFYLDKNKVTNHHFVEFLNAIKATLTISGGIVKKEDRIWLYLGEGNEPHDQIIYENGRFYLRETEYAAHPVVRVTWYGAAAYASHYNKGLLTEYEWKYLNAKNLVGDVTGPSEKETFSAPDQHNHMMSLPPRSEDAHMKAAEVDKGTNATAHPMPSPQSNDKKYRKAIPKEWITQNAAVFKKRLKEGVKGSEVYNSLVADPSIGADRESINYRYPWEAFADVGFRCMLPLSPK
jgi:formylglycine-generating enzyme required for sulfatase activity